MSDNTPNVRENQGHHLRMMYELKLSLAWARGGSMRLSGSRVEFCFSINSCTRLGFFSYRLASSVRDSDDVRHINSSNVNLCHVALEPISSFVFIFIVLRVLVSTRLSDDGGGCVSATLSASTLLLSFFFIF